MNNGIEQDEQGEEGGGFSKSWLIDWQAIKLIRKASQAFQSLSFETSFWLYSRPAVLSGYFPVFLRLFHTFSNSLLLLSKESLPASYHLLPAL